jgi:hypothetical protein
MVTLSCLSTRRRNYYNSRFWRRRVRSCMCSVFWVVAPCRLVEVYRRLMRPYCLHHRSHDVGKLISVYTRCNAENSRLLRRNYFVSVDITSWDKEHVCSCGDSRDIPSALGSPQVDLSVDKELNAEKECFGRSTRKVRLHSGCRASSWAEVDENGHHLVQKRGSVLSGTSASFRMSVCFACTGCSISAETKVWETVRFSFA